MEYVIVLEPPFLKYYDFKHEGIWEVCLSGTQLDHSVQNISQSNLLLIGGQKLHKSGSVLLENTHEIKVLHSLCLTWDSLLFFPLVVPSHLEIKETGYIKPSWKSEASTEFILLIKLRFLADQGQITEFRKIFPLISRFFTSKTSQRDLADGCQGAHPSLQWGTHGERTFKGLLQSCVNTRSGWPCPGQTGHEVSWEKINGSGDVGLRLGGSHLSTCHDLHTWPPSSCFCMWNGGKIPHLFLSWVWHIDNIGPLVCQTLGRKIRNKTPVRSYVRFFFLPGMVFPPLCL